MVNMPLLMISHAKVYREEHTGKVIWAELSLYLHLLLYYQLHKYLKLKLELEAGNGQRNLTKNTTLCCKTERGRV